MLLFIGGPSCSGKTMLASHWRDVRCIHLDKHRGPLLATAAGLKQRNETAIFEGLLSGGTEDIGQFLALMDYLIVLDAPFVQRAGRMLRRDGLGSTPRFLRNEFFWRTHNRPILLQPKYDAIRRGAALETAMPAAAQTGQSLSD